MQITVTSADIVKLHCVRFFEMCMCAIRIGVSGLLAGMFVFDENHFLSFCYAELSTKIVHIFSAVT